jgi:predicted glycosyltransferase
MTAPRFIFYSHDGLGLGHLRRNLAIAAALTEADPDASVLLVTGCIELGAQWLAPNVDIVAIPGLRKLGNGRYGARRLPMSGGEIRAMRAAQIKAVVESFRPDVLLIDKHPMGVRGELRPALDSLAGWNGQAVLGLRDILDDPATVREEWARDGVIEFTEEHCRRLLIYGNPGSFDFVGEYGLPPSLARRSRYCSYVVNHEPDGDAPDVDALPANVTRFAPRPRVLASAGGGEDGRALIETFIHAARGARWDAVAVAGPQSSPDDQQALRRMAIEAGVEFHELVPELSSWLTKVDALVCMGGYNTLSEALSRGTPTLCVPRVHPRTEQLIRARLFDELGLLRLVEPWRLDPELLRSEVAALLGSDRREIAARAQASLRFDGAALAARALLELARDPLATGRPDELAAARFPTADLATTGYPPTTFPATHPAAADTAPALQAL